jgi:CAAX protease family protein
VDNGRDVTETQFAPAAFGSRPMRHTTPGRISTARLLVFIEAPFLALVGLTLLNGGSWLGPTLAFAGAGVLVWGGFRIGRDLSGPPPVTRAEVSNRVPWDWTDVVIFIPAAYAAAAILQSIVVPIGDQVTSGAEASLRTAVESFLGQFAFYAGGLFNIWVLASLRRGAVLFDIGWRRFQWWWIPAAVGIAYVTLQVASYLEILSQQLMPSAQNTQCTAVRAEYSQNFIWLAAIVVCVMAPFAEELIFRGFIYGWAKRAMPVPLAIVVAGAIFGAAHQVSLLFIPLFAVGVVLALVFQGSRSVFPGMLTHALFNIPGLIGYLSAPSC